MESAIPNHLQCPRTQPARAAEDYVPSYPAWAARMGVKVTQIVMGYFGIQYKKAQANGQPAAFADKMREHFSADKGPGHFEFAHYVDEAGFDTVLAIAYWASSASFSEWQARSPSSTWWDSPERVGESVGYFREIFQPSADRLETLFSTKDRSEGVARLSEHFSSEIREHGYWGGMRDRFAVAQTDALQAVGHPVAIPSERDPGRVRVLGHENLAVIRSGQEWTDTEGKERKLYLGKVEPIFRKGMDFLRDAGLPIGCYTNRYMDHVDAEFSAIQKRFGLSYWHSLGELESWAESHPTHAAIFGSFMKMVEEMNFDLKLRLYHEVTVVSAKDQFFEYICCHDTTGLLRGCGRQEERSVTLNESTVDADN